MDQRRRHLGLQYPGELNMGAPIPGTNPGETAWFDMIGAGNVDISAATANPVRFDFMNWMHGSDYLVTAADGVHQGLSEVRFHGEELSVTLATAGTGTYVLNGPTDFRLESFFFATNTVSGVLTDGSTPGGLNIWGFPDSTLTLSGANTYTGATTIGAGTTLALSATGSIADSCGVVNNGTFSITGDKTIDSLSGSGATNLNGILTIGDDSGTSCTYSGITGGTGGLTKAGAGTLTLSGVNTYTGATTVTAGTFILNDTGSITSNLDNWATSVVNGDVFGNVTNNVDAILRGAGTVTGSLNNSGTVSPSNSVGTLNVVGSFSQDAGGTLEVEIASAASYDKVVVTGAPGTATLAGTIKPVLLGGYNPQPNTLLKDVITATGGVTGTFDTVDAAFPCRVLYYDNSIDLLLIMFPEEAAVTPPFNYADPSFPLTANQRRIGEMFNAVNDSATGDLRAVMDLISQLPGGASVADAYQQISPDKAGALPAVSLAGSMMQWRTLANRLTYLRWRGSDGGGGETGLSPAFGRRGSGKMNLSYNNLSGLMLAYNGGSLGSLLSGKGKQANPGKRWGIFADFVGAIGNQGSSANQTGYDYQIFGFNSGVDYRLRPDLIIGAGSGYYHTATSFRGSGGSAEVNSIPFYAYGLYSPGSFYIMGSVGYTLNLYGLNRDLSFAGLPHGQKFGHREPVQPLRGDRL
jgi:fibronectin-binding autotransporter adhesin